MAHSDQKDGETLSEVNVIPLADLSLVLLIILMVLSPFVSQALIQVQKAQASAAVTKEENTQPEVPVIVSYAPGDLKLNGAKVTDSLDLALRLDQVMPKRRDRTVLLTASPDVIHGDVVNLMDVIRRHGGDGLTMVKWDPNAQPPEPIEQASLPTRMLKAVRRS